VLNSRIAHPHGRVARFVARDAVIVIMEFGNDAHVCSITGPGVPVNSCVDSTGGRCYARTRPARRYLSIDAEDVARRATTQHEWNCSFCVVAGHGKWQGLDATPLGCYPGDMKPPAHPVIAAANAGRVDETALALVTASANDRAAALRRAAICGHLDVIRGLLAAGTNIHANQNDALRLAASEGHAAVVRFLLTAGADVHAKCDGALRRAAANHHTEVVQMLMAASADIHAGNEDALRSAAAFGYVDVVRCLLAAGADVHASNDEALRLSVLRGHIEVIQILIDAGADVHVSNDCVIGQAAFNGHIEVVRLLLAVGINPRAASDAPLRHAASHGHTEIVRVLLAAGADPVTAWLTSKPNRRRDIASSFDACADAMTPAQCGALTAASDLFVGLNAVEKSALQHQGLQR